MGRGREIDWRREWEEEQRDAETAQKRVPFWWSPKTASEDDWAPIPILHAQHDPPAGWTRLYVVQTCRWRGEWDECACWSPEDGHALGAHVEHANAESHATLEEHLLGARVGLVEVDVEGPLGGEVFLVKGDNTSWHRSRDNPQKEGRIQAVFKSRPEAEQDALHRDREEWHRMCLFSGFFTLDWTSLPPALVGDLFLDLGVPGPPLEEEVGYEAVWEWWRRTAPTLDGWQSERLRQAMDRFADHRVVPAPLMG
jgi:hypothetical protein